MSHVDACNLYREDLHGQIPDQVSRFITYHTCTPESLELSMTCLYALLCISGDFKDS